MAVGHKIRYSRASAVTVRDRNLKLSGKIAIGMAMYQNSSNLEKVAMVTWKSGIADFSAPFGPEGIIIDPQNI